VAVRELLLELAGEAVSFNVLEDIVQCIKGDTRGRLVKKTYRCWLRCHPTRSGTGTKMTMALRPWPTSICKIPGQREAFQCPPPLHRSCFFFIQYLRSNVDVHVLKY
jgi:hypothetical protein